MQYINLKNISLFIFSMSIAGSLYPMQHASKQIALIARTIAQNPTIRRIAPGFAFGAGVGTAVYLVVRHRGTISQLATSGWQTVRNKLQASGPIITIHELPANVLEEIAQYLPAADIATMRLSCKDMANRFWSPGTILKLECREQADLHNIEQLSRRFPGNGIAIRTCPEMVSQLTHADKITSLILRNLAGTQLPKEIARLKNLRELNLTLSELPDDAIVQIIAVCPRIKKLNLYHTNIRSIPAEIEQLTDLTDLNLAACKEFNWVAGPLEPFLKNICRIKNLIALNLANTKGWNSLVPEFATLTKLKSLDLTGTGLTSNALLPLQDLKLEHLDASGIQTYYNLGCIPQITSLQKLNLSSTELSSENLEEIARSLSNLTSLALACSETKELPSVITRLTRLTSLDLRSNPLTPQALSVVCAMTNLQSLDISACNLTDLPNQIANLRNLKTLIAYSNNFTTRTLQKIAAILNQLETLDIMNNRIDSIPQEMASMTNLQTLLIGACFDGLLTEEAIIVACTLCPRIKELSFSNHHLSSFSTESLAACSNLRKLTLFGNNFSKAEEERISAALPNTKLQF